MRIILDGAAVQNKEDLHEQLAQALYFPAWYGRSLDALFDCLTDLREDTEIVLRHPEALEAHLGVYAGRLRRTLGDAAAENPRIHLTAETEREGE